MQASEKHEAAFQDMCQVLKRHSDLTPAEMLAVASNFVGKLIAMQDQRTMTRERALHILMKNIELGNQQAMEELLNSKGQA